MFSAQEYLNIDQLIEVDKRLNLGLIQDSVKKGSIFLRAGQKCNHLYYIRRGFVRVYYLDIEGKEITHWFCAKNSIITSPFSFRKQEKNILFFEALEDTELILIGSNQLEKMIESRSDIETSFRHINAEFAMILSRRIMSIHTKTAEERYLDLMKEHPLLFQKAKLSHIASFLGITQQSLSRIRKNL